MNAPVPIILHGWMAGLIEVFSARTRDQVLALVLGAILATGRRTVAAALRVTGLAQLPGFTSYHRVLNRNTWSSRELAGRLLQLLVRGFVPDGPILVGLDDTLERRRGAKIKAKGIYRDPVRSSHSHFVKASGLRWLSLMLLAPIPFAGRVWALPFLSVLAPSERYHAQRGTRHKTRLGIWMNAHGSCRIWRRKSGFQLAVLRRVLTLPLALLARTKPRAKRRTMAMFRAPYPLR